MFWKVSTEEVPANTTFERIDGRFVLHRHQDGEGPHLDLRVEHEGCLMGWRIDAVAIDGEPWATEKAPHSKRWLEDDGDAIRIDSGNFMWLERGPERRTLLLAGSKGVRRVCVECEGRLGASTAREIFDMAKQQGLKIEETPRLLADGIAARRRAIERLCGLGRELDGDSFADAAWRKLLAPLSLTEIHEQLRAYEVRFDKKFAPAPVSRPERLPEIECSERTGLAMSIARE